MQGPQNGREGIDVGGGAEKEKKSSASVPNRGPNSAGFFEPKISLCNEQGELIRTLRDHGKTGS